MILDVTFTFSTFAFYVSVFSFFALLTFAFECSFAQLLR